MFVISEENNFRLDRITVNKTLKLFVNQSREETPQQRTQHTSLPNTSLSTNFNFGSSMFKHIHGTTDPIHDSVD